MDIIDNGIKFAKSQPIIKGKTAMPLSAKENFSTKNRLLYSPTHDVVFLQRALNKNSESAKFFGVDSQENLYQNIENQLALSLLKCKEQNIITFPTCNLDNPKYIKMIHDKIWEGENAQINELFDTGAARFTLSSKHFGTNSEGFHTIGLVYDKNSKTLYLLDSLPQNEELVQKYIEVIQEQLFSSKNNPELIKKIIVSTKPQQEQNQFTCNNWTHANIEAVKAALNNGHSIQSSEELNKILPDNINEILKEQHQYVEEKLQGKTIYDLVENGDL